MDTQITIFTQLSSSINILIMEYITMTSKVWMTIKLTSQHYINIDNKFR